GSALAAGALLRALWRHLRPYGGKLALLITLLLLDAGLTAAVPLGIKFLVDDAIVPQNRTLLLWGLGALAAATLLVSAAAIARDWLYAYVGAAVLNDLRTALFDQMQRL